MVGDRIDNVALRWTEWIGGADHVSHGRTCVGTAEHVATGWVLLRRPRGGLVLKKLRPGAVAAHRLAATRPGAEHINMLSAWVDDDDRNRAERRRRAEASRARHAADIAAEAAHQAEREALADDPDDCPY